MRKVSAGDVVSRRKGLVMHKGLYLGGGRVLHNTPGRGEHVCSEYEFRAGRRLHVERGQRGRSPLLHSTMLESERRSYNLFTNNCEHTVTRLTEGKPKSRQLRSWAVGATLAVATFALTRHPTATGIAYVFGRKLAGKLR